LFRNQDSKIKYEEIESELKVKIRKAKRKQKRELSKKEDRNGKKFTNYTGIKAKTKTRTGIGPLKKADGTTTTDSEEMANIHNDFFTSVFTQENRNNIPTVVLETNKTLSSVSIPSSPVIQSLTLISSYRS
jgi:hypothetical protein